MDAPYDLISAGTRPERFWANVSKAGPDDCWPWQRAANGSGYGVHRCGRDGISYTTMVHRVAWALANGGPVPAGLVVDHLCSTRKCCNPRHLRVIDQRANVRASSWHKAGDAPVVRYGPRGMRKRGTRYLVHWREYLEDGRVRQAAKTYETHEAAVAALSRVVMPTSGAS